MKISIKSITLMGIITILCSACGNSAEKNNEQKASVDQQMHEKKNIQIILGSTRQGRTADKIGHAIKAMADKRADVHTEIIDLRDYNVPFLNDEVAPASRTTITDPVIQKWSDKISQADGFIMIVPEYNAGYPGVLKNALDSLYKEWNNKPVAFVGYSGGNSGGKNALAQLRQVALGLEMLPIDQTITIPSAWKAFDTKGALHDHEIEPALNAIINQMVKTQK